MSSTAHLVTARKRHRCEDYPTCGKWIEPGEDYVRAIAFPGDTTGRSPSGGRADE